MPSLNKPWDEMNHPIKILKTPFEDTDGNIAKISINTGTYWGCRSCDYEALVSEVPLPDNGLCLDCNAQ
jgi:hypothetical protein